MLLIATRWFLLLVGTLSMDSVRHLRVGYLEQQHIVVVERDDSNRPVFKGLSIEILNWIAANLNFTYEPVEINYTGFAGLAEEFSNKGLHLGIQLFGLKEGRNKIMTHLFPVDFSTNTLIIPYPKRENDAWGFIKPYDFTVWVLILVSMIFLAILFKLLAARKHSPNQETNNKNLASEVELMYLIGVLTNQGGYFSSRIRSTSRLVAGLWCLAALVLVNAYSGSLTTYMTTPTIIPIVNSIEEMIRRDDLQLLTTKIDFIRDVILTDTGHLKPLAKNINRVSPDICGDASDSTEFELCVEKVKNGDHVIATDKDTGDVIIEKDFKKSGDCALTQIEHPFIPTFAGMVVPLSTTKELRNTLNVSILKAVSYGLIEKWQSEFYPVKRNPCKDFRTQPNIVKKLSLTSFISAFTVLGIGCGLSLFVFIYELMRNKLTLKKFQK